MHSPTPRAPSGKPAIGFNPGVARLFWKETATTPVTTVGIVTVAFVVFLALAATAVWLLETPTHPIPSDVLDGLTSPTSLGQRTTS
jgi:hypothetical protein